MKPSERRALEAEKRAQKEAEVREKELARDAKRSELETDGTRLDNSEQPEEIVYVHERKKEEKPNKRKEGFFQSHVRLITFIITATLVATVFGPLGVDMIVAAKNNKIVNNKEDISITTVYSVYDNAEIIEWKNFRNFNYTDYSYDSDSGTYQIREYPISNSRLVLKVGGPALSNRPDYIYLIDYRTGENIDVYREDPRDYVKQMQD